MGFLLSARKEQQKSTNDHQIHSEDSQQNDLDQHPSAGRWQKVFQIASFLFTFLLTNTLLPNPPCQRRLHVWLSNPLTPVRSLQSFSLQGFGSQWH